MKKNILFYIIILLILIGCSLKSNNELSNNRDYIEAKQEFDYNLVDHFPDSINSNNFFIRATNYQTNSIEFMLITNNEEMLDSLFMKKKSLHYYNADDTCLLVVNRYINEDNYYKADDIRDRDLSTSCDSSYLPIPNFWRLKFEHSNNITKLPDDYSIYILEAKAGAYLNSDLSKPSRTMPKKWKNGYSKGICKNERTNTIIYWLIIW